MQLAEITMEPALGQLTSDTPTEPAAVRAYRHAKRVVVDQGFAGEIDWQAGIQFENVSEEYFLREAAWVVLSAGMREAVVRKVFPRVSEAFRQWRGAAEIVMNRSLCVSSARNAFNHPRKIEAIADIADRVHTTGFELLKQRIVQSDISYLQTFPFIGPITSFHLAKNLGLNVVKPDRHLVRAAAAAGYSTPDQMCRAISGIVGDSVAVVDLVIWRFATLTRNYAEVFMPDGMPTSGTV